MTSPELDPSRIPSFDVIESALTREEDSYRARAASIDTKAGILLSGAGVLVALVGARPSVAGLLAQGVAIGAGAVAVGALWPRVDKGIRPGNLRDRYLTQQAALTRLVLLNTRIDLHAKDEEHLVQKARRLRLAALLLLAAAAVVVVGGMVEVIRN